MTTDNISPQNKESDGDKHMIEEARNNLVPYFFDSIPAELKSYDNWVLWRYGIRINKEDGKKKLTKPPYTVNGYKAATNKPETWTSFDKAVAVLQSGIYNGIGFVFTGTPYVGIDIDDCRDVATGEITPEAAEVITLCNSYVEISPSGEGIHIIIKGKLPPGRRKRKPFEMYGENSPRYFTMTGLLYNVGGVLQ